MSGGSDAAGSGGETLSSIDEVFSVLADETRLEILVELTEVVTEEGLGHGLSFSALQDRVGVADSGRFNYHLDKLTGQFVTKHDGRYIARWPALMLISAIHAGLYDKTATLESDGVTSELTCPNCLDPLEVRILERPLGTSVYMYCQEHGEMDNYWFPPGARSGRSSLEAMRVAYTRLLTNVRLARQGICMECWGRISIEYPVESPASGTDEEGGRNEFTYVAFRCERCWNRFPVPLRTYVVTHPVVEAAFERRGYELLAAADALTTGHEVACKERLVSEDPLEARVQVTFDDGDTLVISVDADGSVSDYRWR